MVKLEVLNEGETLAALEQSAEEQVALRTRLFVFGLSSLESVVLPESETTPPYIDVDEE